MYPNYNTFKKYPVYQPYPYYQDERFGLVPLLLGGVAGYAIGTNVNNNQQPTYYYPITPYTPYYNQYPINYNYYPNYK